MIYPEHLIDYLQKQVISSEEMEEGPDEVSWAYEKGILISRNDAIEILRLLTTNSTPTNP